jgi:5-formyltetrahydrofolate cyclo-ligase
MTSEVAEVQRRKRELRRDRLRARMELPSDRRDSASGIIAEKVIHSALFRRSRLIGCYLSLAEEVDTWRIISRAWRTKKRIFAPVTARNRMLVFRELTPESDLIVDDYGLTMPASGEEIAARKLDLVLTPLVAFDENCQRIGMGGGYYDRTFSFLRGRRLLLKPKLVGLAFACQEVPAVAANPWDIRLFSVITESG